MIVSLTWKGKIKSLALCGIVITYRDFANNHRIEVCRFFTADNPEVARWRISVLFSTTSVAAQWARRVTEANSAGTARQAVWGRRRRPLPPRQPQARPGLKLPVNVAGADQKTGYRRPCLLRDDRSIDRLCRRRTWVSGHNEGRGGGDDTGLRCRRRSGYSSGGPRGILVSVNL